MFIKYPFVFSWKQNQAWRWHRAEQYRYEAEWCWTMRSVKGCGAGRNFKLFSTDRSLHDCNIHAFSSALLCSSWVLQLFLLPSQCHASLFAPSTVFPDLSNNKERRRCSVPVIQSAHTGTWGKSAVVDRQSMRAWISFLTWHSHACLFGVLFYQKKKETTGLGLQRSPEIWLFSCAPVSARQR